VHEEDRTELYFNFHLKMFKHFKYLIFIVHKLPTPMCTVLLTIFLNIFETVTPISYLKLFHTVDGVQQDNQYSVLHVACILINVNAIYTNIDRRRLNFHWGSPCLVP